jgi:hypothetical protein
MRPGTLLHYQRDDQVVAVSLWLLALPVAVSWLVSRVSRRWL